MKLDLTQRERELLAAENIPSDYQQDYTADEALELLDLVRNAEAEYAQDYGNDREALCEAFCLLGDKTFELLECI